LVASQSSALGCQRLARKFVHSSEFWYFDHTPSPRPNPAEFAFANRKRFERRKWKGGEPIAEAWFGALRAGEKSACSQAA